jgi:hypothetical protein
VPFEIRNQTVKDPPFPPVHGKAQLSTIIYQPSTAKNRLDPEPGRTPAPTLGAEPLIAGLIKYTNPALGQSKSLLQRAFLDWGAYAAGVRGFVVKDQTAAGHAGFSFLQLR